MSLGLEITILIVLLALSGFFSGAEVALISLSNSKVHQLVNKKRFGAEHIRKLKDNPQRMLSAILIGNNISNIAAASLMTVVMIGLFGNYAVGAATGIMTILILIFGEITPKSIATQHNVSFSQVVAAPIWYMSRLLWPILVALDWFLNTFLRFLGLKAKPSMITEEEIKSIVRTAEKEGSIKEIEKKLITNVFDFDETTVGEIMTPRTDIVMITSDSTVGDALKLIAKEKHSRIPVYKGQKDNIIGILYLRDLLDHKSTMDVSRVMKDPYVIPETKFLSDTLRKFQNRKEHIALVVDEHGIVIGMVTLEDVLEEIVGEIVDESEKSEPNIQKVNGRTWAVRGRTSVAEVNKKLDIGVPEGDYDTISGFVLSKLGHIPKRGEEFTQKECTIQVQKVKGHRISRILIRK